MQRLMIAMRRYGRGLADVSILALFGAVNLIMALCDVSFYLVFSPFLPTAAYLYGAALATALGEQTLLTAGIFFSLVTVAVWVYLRVRATRRHGAMWWIAALYAADTAVLAVFSFTNGFGIGRVDVFFHLLALLPLLAAAHAGGVIAKTPEPLPELIGEMLLTVAPPPEGLPLGTEVGDAPPDGEDTAPLRAAVPRRRKFFEVYLFGLTILVTRSRGLTELSVNGQVYAEMQGVLELAYSLTATVEGHRVTVRLAPGRLYGRMLLLVDGRLAGEIRRYF